MASLNFCIFLDKCEPKKLSFTVNSSQLSGCCSVSLFAGYVHITGACIVKPFFNFNHIRVSKLQTDLSDVSESNLVDLEVSDSNNCSVSENLVPKFKKGRRNIWKRFRGLKKVNKDVNLKHVSGSSGDNFEKEQEPMFVFGANVVNFMSNGKTELNFDLGSTGPDSSVESCNFTLRQLERGGEDRKALRVFEWMRSNGKLMHNWSAYNIVLRVLSRRDDWYGVGKMIDQMTNVSGCELGFQIFNTLIYSCHKRGLVEMGAKWFKIMLKNQVQPNVASFGMLMSLYQKGSAVEEAEFAFQQMRNFKIKCQTAYSALITIYTRLCWYDKAEEVIGFLREDGVTLDSENWLVMINAYSQQGKLPEAERVLVLMQEAGFSPSIIAYNTLITGYGKMSNMTAAQHLFQSLKILELEPDETTYRSMIEGWGRVDNYKEALWYYKKLKSSGFKPNSSNFYTMINLQARHEDEDGAIRTLEDMMSMGCQYSSVLGMLLQSYERSGRVDRVSSILTGAFYHHVITNQPSCSMLVMAYVKHGLIDEAINVLQDRRWEDLDFEDNLYHLLICLCKELGLLENAIKIFNHMPKSERPNLHITCTMIDIYSVMNLFSEAEDLYLKLRSSGVALDMIAFTIVIRMYVKFGSLKDACSVLDTMEKQDNIVPDTYLLRDMFRIYHKCGMENKLADLYYRILKKGVTWDQEMYNCVINCCARALPVDELSRLLDEMLQQGFVPNTITCNVMLDVYGKARLFRKARKFFWIARKRGWLDVISYNTVIAAYGRSKDLKNMSSMVERMEFNGFSVSLEAYNCMLDAYGKKGEMEKFRSVLQRMKVSSCVSDHFTYNIMINIYGEQGWIEEVADVVVELNECGLAPDLCSYNTLIKAYGIAGMVEDAVNLVKEMRENGIEPDQITYTNLITALQKNDKFLEAVRWSLWMKQMGLRC